MFEYKGIIHRCFRCGYCKFPVNWLDVTNCPSYGRFRMESYSCGGRLWLIRAWINGEIDLSDHLAEIVYSCSVCKNCEFKCPFDFNKYIVNMVISTRKEMVEQGKIPKGVNDFLTNIYLYNNPYGKKKSLRDKWKGEMDVEEYSDSHRYLFYVGCVASFDPVAQKMAKSIANVLKRADISFGILGKKEICDGNEVYVLGEEGLFEEIVQKNMTMFRDYKVKEIIVLSPHAYNAFKNWYPEFRRIFKVYHYTHVFFELLKEGKLKFKRDLDLKVTYHDPCFLGRWNGEYDIPREILKGIPGIRLVEMDRNRESSLCCGGGGGNFYFDFLGGSKESPARSRIREAIATGSDVLVVSCPKCLVMLEDALCTEGLNDRFKVMDLSELVEKALQ